MKRYFFNVYDGETSIDEDGLMLENFETVRKEAIRYAGALIEEADTVDGFPNGWRMEVVDDVRRLILTLRFKVEPLIAD